MVEIAQNLFTTRRGSLLVGAAAAIVAGVILLVYLHAYRNSLNSSAANVPVLVARNLIPKGTPGDLVGSGHQYQVAQVPKGQLQVGALTDPATLTGRIAVANIYPNQQLTANYFAYATPGSLQTKIAGDDRAISVSIDSQHGMVGATEGLDVRPAAGPGAGDDIGEPVLVDIARGHEDAAAEGVVVGKE